MTGSLSAAVITIQTGHTKESMKIKQVLLWWSFSFNTIGL